MYYARMKHSRDIIPTERVAEIARVTGKSVHTVTSWRQRNSIPADVWAPIVELGLASFEDLAAVRAVRT